jgi:N6-L-threonylcarbamoyladenine synthase
MIILSIETSCDDTGISIIKAPSAPKNRQISFNDFEVLADMISSQASLHAEYGGVFPALAKREHQKNLVPLLIKVLKKAGMLKKNTKGLDVKKIEKLNKMLDRNQDLFLALKDFFKKYKAPEVDKIAVTVGPGLEPCLWTGINLARALSFYSKTQLVGINHIEGHILSNWLQPIEKVEFPAMALVVSGGNTQLILMKSIGKYEIIGETRDDAAGECFDKTARMLGLKYPGGPNISREAEKFVKSGEEKYNISLPRPMIHEKNYDFSFSGLKTSVLYDLKKRGGKTKKSQDYIEEMSYNIEQAIIDVLISKTMKASREFSVKSIIIGGGVSGNKRLVKTFRKEAKSSKIQFFSPLPSFSGDNASMIGLSAVLSKNIKKTTWQKIEPNSNFKIDE